MSRADYWGFYSGALAAGEEIVLDAEESRHALKVRRLSAGMSLTVTNGRGQVAQAAIIGDTPNRAEARLRIEQVRSVPPPRSVTLACALPKGERLTALLEAATQLGATQIQPLHCAFTPPAAQKINPERAGRILISALKQAHRAYLPELLSIDTPQASAKRAINCIHLLADPDGGPVADALPESTTPLCLWIGPEGGFSEAERGFLTQAGAKPVCLGRHILRIETAAAVLLGLVGNV